MTIATWIRRAAASAALALCASTAAAAPEPDAGGTEAVLPSIHARVIERHGRRPAELPDDGALITAGARIGEIRVVPLPIFDTSRSEEDTKLFRLANRLHVETRPATIESQLLFRSGEAYDPRRLEESARLLRETRYLHDAEIVPVAWHDGRVDVEVRTQDVWTLNPGISFGRAGGRNSSGFEVEELNLLGRGTQLALAYKSDVDRTSTTFHYADQQLGHSWWSADLRYADNSDGRRAELSLDHPFYSLDTHGAGGLFLVDDDRIDRRYDLGEELAEFRTQHRFASVYAGRSAGRRDGYTLRWSAGYTYDERRFERTPNALSVAVAPPDRTLAYPWVGIEWIEDAWRTARNRDLIERTEDFSLGWHASARLGFASRAFGADRSAAMLEGRVARGFEPSDHETWLLDSSLSGRLESSRVADAVLSASARYYRRQSPRRLFFAALSVDATHNLDPDRQLLLGGDTGLRGYPLRYQGGEGRWLLTLEQRGFTKWFPFRLFNVGGAAFVDVGGTWGDNPFGTRTRGVLKDVGFGLRLGNSRSALGNVLHIDVAFPLDGEPSIRDLQFLVETKRTF